MSKMKTFSIPAGTNINTAIDIAAQNLSMQGFDVKSQVIGPTAAEVIITKDREGFKNFLGLGLESRVAITATGDMLNLSITDEWVNKIIALVVGWFLCWVPIITGIIGIINQAGLSEKINTAFSLALNSGAANIPNQAPAESVEPQNVDFTDVNPQ